VGYSGPLCVLVETNTWSHREGVKIKRRAVLVWLVAGGLTNAIIKRCVWPNYLISLISSIIFSHTTGMNHLT